MNLHCPQSIECVSELMHIANVDMQIINPRNSAPVISLIQDPKLAIYKIGLEHENLRSQRPHPDLENKYYFDKKYFMDLMIYNNDFTNIRQLPEDTHGYYSGEQVLSTVLPSINMKKENFTITNGTLKGTIIQNDAEIIHNIHNKFGKDTACNFINNVQNVLNQYLSKAGFSVGISDLIIDDNIKADIKNTLQEKVKNIDKILYNIQNGLLEKKYCNNLHDEFELLVNKELNSAVDIAGDILLQNLNSVDNSFIMMATSGSKGKSLNLSQMISCVGQQNLEGKRIPSHFGNRTLPHFPQFDNSAMSKGFVESSFYGGINPFEYFFHAMGGREGLIDTAVKTSETGYIQRRLIKAMEDIKICYDNTVRNHNEHIIQFSYGDDNISPVKLEKIKMNKEIYCDLLEFESRYKNYINTDLKFVLDKNIYKTTIANKSNKLFDTYYNKLLDGRIYLLQLFGTSIDTELIVVPVNVDNLILDNINLFQLNNNLSDILPSYINETVNNLIDEFNAVLNNKVFSITLLFKLSPYNIIFKNKLTKLIFDKLIEDIKRIYYNSFIDPGTMVGTVAAQAMGEQCTQMTLNTFHSAGVSANSSVILGLPRLKEILNISKNLKSPSVSISLKKKHLDLSEIKQIENNIIIVTINNIIVSSSLYFDPDDSNSVVPEDQEIINKYIEFQNQFNINDLFVNDINRCPFVLRLEFDKYTMIKYDLSMNNIYNKIISYYGNNVDIIYSDNNRDHLIFRIKFKEKLNPLNDYIELFKKLENNILKIILNGIKNIKNTNISKFKNISITENGTNKGTFEVFEDITIETSGTNLLDIINLDYVDSYKTISNHIYEVFNIYGIEVAKQLLINEMTKTFYSSGAIVDIRHVLLLINIITYKGYLMSIDRFGIKKSDYGILAQSSFEETPELLSRASIFAESDHVKGVSGNIILGQRIKGGTGMFQLLFDEVGYFSNFNKIHNIQANLSVYNIDDLDLYVNFKTIDDVDLMLPEITVNLI
jgi:DNA-directed RNA polymerase II subunit RPB1